MNPLCRLFVFGAALASLRSLPAQVPLGTVVATYPLSPAKVLADPVRHQVYVADTSTNRLAVIDTTTLKVTATVSVGSNPGDLAISQDGNTLYVANRASTAAAVTVVDLTTLTVRASFTLPGAPVAVAAGLGGRLYVSATGDFETAIHQVDGATGAVQTSFNSAGYDNDLFQISPNGTRLFVASLGVSPGSLKSFDVSTAVPVRLQDNQNASENDSQLVISHNGKYLCLPSGGGNPGAGGYATFLFAASDVNAHYGAFNNGPYPGPLAFSPDDSLVYQMVDGGGGGDPHPLQVFSTQTFTNTDVTTFPALGSTGSIDTVSAIVVDNTGSYLFIGQTSAAAGSPGTSSGVGQVTVVATGAGTLLPPPVVTLVKPVVSNNAKGISRALVAGPAVVFKGVVVGGQGGIMTLNVTLTGHRPAKVRMGANGAWRAAVNGVSPGVYQANVSAVDNAGNQSNPVSLRVVVR